MGIPFNKLKERAESLKEANPMLGHAAAAWESAILNHRNAGPGHFRSGL